MEEQIKLLKGKLKHLDRCFNQAIRYGFEKNQENVNLHRHLLQRAQSIERERENEENG